MDGMYYYPGCCAILIGAVPHWPQHQNPGGDVDWALLGDLDAILLLCGDAAGEEEAVKKSTAFQVRDMTRLTPLWIYHGATTENSTLGRHGF